MGLEKKKSCQVFYDLFVDCVAVFIVNLWGDALSLQNGLYRSSKLYLQLMILEKLLSMYISSSPLYRGNFIALMHVNNTNRKSNWEAVIYRLVM